jgi:hypothetical protein
VAEVVAVPRVRMQDEMQRRRMIEGSTVVVQAVHSGQAAPAMRAVLLDQVARVARAVRQRPAFPLRRVAQPE